MKAKSKIRKIHEDTHTHTNDGDIIIMHYKKKSVETKNFQELLVYKRRRLLDEIENVCSIHTYIMNIYRRRKVYAIQTQHSTRI